MTREQMQREMIELARKAQQMAREYGADYVRIVCLDDDYLHVAVAVGEDELVNMTELAEVYEGVSV